MSSATAEVDSPPRCDQTAQVAQDNNQPQACVTSEECVTITQTSDTEIEVENERENEEDDESSE
jgi:D-arabinose 5-phosphate isomerase GutQ